MKWIVILLLLLGIVAAASAAILMASLRAEAVAQAGTGEPEQMPEVEVLVATRDLSPSTIVDASAVATRSILESDVPEGAATSTIQIVGQYLTVPMVEGQVFLRSDVAGGGGGYTVAPMLPEGSRAMSITLAADAGVAGLIYPGCLVDVIASFRVPGEAGTPIGETVSFPLLQRIHVLAVGGDSVASRSAQSEERSSIVTGQTRQLVTLRVNADEAKMLQLAMAYGQVSLALRNPLDLTTAPADGVLLSQLNSSLARGASQSLDADTRERAMLAPRVESDPAGDPSAPAALAQNDESGSDAEEAGEIKEPEWTTIVLRGGSVEKKSFPMPDSETAATARRDVKP